MTKREGLVALENACMVSDVRGRMQGTRQDARVFCSTLGPSSVLVVFALVFPCMQGTTLPLLSVPASSSLARILMAQVTTELLPTQLRLWSRIVTGHQLFGTRFARQSPHPQHPHLLPSISSHQEGHH